MRRRTVDPKVRASISSVAVAYTLPDLVRAAHWASASQGACSETSRTRQSRLVLGKHHYRPHTITYKFKFTQK